MRVLVTGHLGYIGTVLTPMLLREGYDVVGLDALPSAPSGLADRREVLAEMGEEEVLFSTAR